MKDADFVALTLVAIGNSYIQHCRNMTLRQLEENIPQELENGLKQLGKLHFLTERGPVQKFTEWADYSRIKQFCVVPTPKSLSPGNPELPDAVNYAFGMTQNVIAKITDQEIELHSVSEATILSESINGAKFISILRGLTSGTKVLDWFKEGLELSNNLFKSKLATQNLVDFIDSIQADESNGKMWFVDLCNMLLFGAEHRKDLFTEDDLRQIQELVGPVLTPEYDIQFITRVQQVDILEDVLQEQTNLHNCLFDVIKFAGSNELGRWVDIFKKSESFLNSEPGEGWFMTLLKNIGYSKLALQLLNAAISADVFGGMGSWNDVAVSDMAEYQRLTDSLFQAVQRSLRAAINSGFIKNI